MWPFIVLAAIFAAVFLAGFTLGAPGMLGAVLVFALIASVAKLAKVPIAWVNDKTSKYVAIGSAVLLFCFVGFLGISPFFANGFNLGGITGASIAIPGASQVGQPNVPSSVALTDCQNKVRALNPTLLGKAATLQVNAYDQESDTPAATTADLTTTYYFRNGNSEGNLITTGTDTTAAAVTGFKVGDVVYIYSDSTSYYLEPVEGLCIDGEQTQVNMKIHRLATDAQMLTTCYDKTGANALNAGVSPRNNYNLTLGASQTETIYCELRVNTANRAWVQGAVATRAINDIKDVRVVGSATGESYSKGSVPSFLSTAKISLNDSGKYNYSGGYGAIYDAAQPVLLHAWDTVKPKIAVEASSTDPAFSATVGSEDAAVIQFVDYGWARGSDGAFHLGVATEDVAQSNVGVAEAYQDPEVGKYTGAIIEGI